MSSQASVLFDGQAFVKQRLGGVSRYFAELIAEFRNHPELNVHAAVDLSSTTNVHLAEKGLVRGRRPLWLGRLPAPDEPRKEPWTPSRACPTVPDIIHSTAYKRTRFERRFGSIRNRVRHVVTVHDLIPELQGNPHSGKHWFVGDADAIICVSDTTRRDLLSLHPGIAAPVFVVHHGVKADVFHPGSTPQVSDRPFVVFVGARHGYKRFDVLREAMRALPNSLDLILLGGPLSEQELIDLDRDGLLSRVTAIENPSDEEMARWLRGSQAYVSTSDNEGFGLPVIEAMASGVPVILSDIPVYREIGSDAPLYFPPGDSAALAQRIVEVTEDSALRARRSKMVLEQARGRTWERCASETAQIYHRLLDEA